MTLGNLLLCMREVCFCRKNVCRRGSTRILTDSKRNRNWKEVLANYIKTRINIGHQQDLWMELKEPLTAQTHDEVPFACSLEIGTCIINNALRQAAHKY
jgi:hypothetical protein